MATKQAKQPKALHAQVFVHVDLMEALHLITVPYAPRADTALVVVRNRKTKGAEIALLENSATPVPVKTLPLRARIAKEVGIAQRLVKPTNQYAIFAELVNIVLPVPDKFLKNQRAKAVKLEPTTTKLVCLPNVRNANLGRVRPSDLRLVFIYARLNGG